MQIAVSSPSDLPTALAAAKPGDTLALAAGEYQAPKFTGVTSVSIVAHDPSRPPRFIGGATISKSINLAFERIVFEQIGARVTSANVVTVAGGSNIQFMDCQILGEDRADGLRFGRGLVASNTSVLLITGCRFERLYRGCIISQATDTLFSNNDLFDLGSDGLDLGQVRGIIISRNQFAGFRPKAGDHPDGIQVMTAANGLQSEDVSISENLIAGSLDGRPQGIFLKAENKAVRHRHIRIDDNIIVDAGFHAITAGQSDDVTISGNTCLIQKTDEIDKSWIKAEAGARIFKNKAVRYLVDPTDQRVVESVNEIIPPATSEQAAAAISAWRARYRPSPPTPSKIVGEVTINGVVYDVVTRT